MARINEVSRTQNRWHEKELETKTLRNPALFDRDAVVHLPWEDGEPRMVRISLRLISGRGPRGISTHLDRLGKKWNTVRQCNPDLEDPPGKP